MHSQKTALITGQDGSFKRRATLNEVYKQLNLRLLPICPHLQDEKPIYQDFRGGDAHHSLADISKAIKLLRYCSSHHFSEAVKVAMKRFLFRVSDQDRLTYEG